MRRNRSSRGQAPATSTLAAGGRSSTSKHSGLLPIIWIGGFIVFVSYAVRADLYGHAVWPRGEGLFAKLVWLISDPFVNFRLHGEDLPIVATYRSPDDWWAVLFSHAGDRFEPLFGFWTHVLAASSHLASLPSTLATTVFVLLIAQMVGGAWLVAQETQSRAAGLAAMAGLGVTTVMDPSATQYAASQILLVIVLILLMLSSLQRWRGVDGVLWLVVAALAVLTAPLVGWGGFAAGVAGAAYLAAEPRRCHHKAVLVPIVAFVSSPGLVLLVAPGSHRSMGDLGHTLARVGDALAEAARLLPETLFLNNLGLDATLTPIQGAVLIGLFVRVWLWTRSRTKLNPFEAAGATLAVASAILAGFVRASSQSETPMSHHSGAISQLGLVLFLAGWWSNVHDTRTLADKSCAIQQDSPQRRSGAPLGSLTKWQVVALVGLTVSLFILQGPRVQRLLLDSVPPLSDVERKRFPIPELQRLRALYLASEESASQRRALARLDKAESAARSLGVGREEIRQVLGSGSVPGWPKALDEPIPLELLDLPQRGKPASPDRIRSVLGALLAPEPLRPPEWLELDAPWPPPSPE